MMTPSDCFFKQTWYSVTLWGVLLNGINSFVEEVIENIKEIVNDKLQKDGCKNVK